MSTTLKAAADRMDTSRVFAVRAALPGHFRAMVDPGGGRGLRQGEILGVAVDAIAFEADTLHVVQQLKLSRSNAVFAPPKGGMLRDVPLPGPVADALRAHVKEFPPVEITLPWKVADGPPVTKRLIFTGPRGGHVWRTSLNEERSSRHQSVPTSGGVPTTSDGPTKHLTAHRRPSPTKKAPAPRRTRRSGACWCRATSSCPGS